MQAQVFQSNQSLTIQIPHSVASEVGLYEGMSLELCVKDGHLALIPVKPAYELDSLLSQITPENIHEPVDTGEAVGQEFW
jgi:antitoxin MazE